ncbi:MAG: hypothetical protein ACI8RZ_007448 [Myxococcota bacterium]|jgi:hypothetical protein
MSDIVTWDLWLHPNGRHTWHNPTSRFAAEIAVRTSQSHLGSSESRPLKALWCGARYTG